MYYGLFTLGEQAGVVLYNIKAMFWRHLSTENKICLVAKQRFKPYQLSRYVISSIRNNASP